MSNLTNARDEFLTHTNGRNILCAKIVHFGSGGEEKKFSLTTGWTRKDFSEFLKEINFRYDSGFGGQCVVGTIWYEDGTWSSRSEYDGSEWWSYNMCPEIPEELKRPDKVRDQKIEKIIT